MSAIVLVPLAMLGATAAIGAGNVRRVPPPAMEFMTPARKAENVRIR